jgi:very-short-patch-repair endonuclease
VKTSKENEKKQYCKVQEFPKNPNRRRKKLWSILRNRQLTGVKFRRQFSLGKYILDFYSPEYKLGIEADGGQHYENSGKQRDKIRTEKLSRLGVKILRFSDLDILNNIEGTWEVIQGVLEKKTPSPQSSPR